MGVRGQFLEKQKLCLQNVTKEWKQPPVVIRNRRVLQYTYSMLVAKNYQKIRSRCLLHEFSFTDIFNNVNYGNKAALLKKKSLWLLQFYMDVASYCYYETVRRTMHTAIVSYFYSFLAAKLNNIESEDEVFAQEFSYEEIDF